MCLKFLNLYENNLDNIIFKLLTEIQNYNNKFQNSFASIELGNNNPIILDADAIKYIDNELTFRVFYKNKDQEYDLSKKKIFKPNIMRIFKKLLFYNQNITN